MEFKKVYATLWILLQLLLATVAHGGDCDKVYDTIADRLEDAAAERQSKLAIRNAKQAGTPQEIVSRLRRDIAAGVEQYPEAFKRIIHTNKSWQERLAEARGIDIFEVGRISPNYRGGEGRVYRVSDAHKALKVWGAKRLGDFNDSVNGLIVLEGRIAANPKLQKNLNVARVYERGPDYIVKEFYPQSVELASVVSPKLDGVLEPLRSELIEQSNLAKRAIEELQDVLLDESDEISQRMLSALSRRQPSGNLHWDKTTKKIVIIDMLGF